MNELPIRNRVGPFRYALRLSLAFALLGLPALASDRPETIRLPDSGRFPENVASASGGTLFVSSITDGGVLRIGAGDTTATAFLKPGEHGTRSTFGVLWPTTSAGRSGSPRTTPRRSE